MAKKIKSPFKDKREFLNKDQVTMPGAIALKYSYNTDYDENSIDLSGLSINIGDCTRTIRIDFDFNYCYSNLKERKVELAAAKSKIDILKKYIDEAHAAIHGVELKPNRCDEREAEEAKKKKQLKKDQ